jgi:hypothetical protein
MKKQNLKYRIEKDKPYSERPYMVIENSSNKVLAVCKTREDAEEIIHMQTHTPTFGNQPIPEFLKESR